MFAQATLEKLKMTSLLNVFASEDMKNMPLGSQM